jgi:rhomboid family GlyGly-CTERM serine protease
MGRYSQASLTANPTHAPTRPADSPRTSRAPVVAAVLIGPLVVLLLLGDDLNPLLQYERGQILAGEWWRLITGHFVHLDTPHLAINVFVILAWLYLFDQRDDLGTVVWIFLGYALWTSLGMLLLSPDLEWMLGASAITYALISGSAFRASLEGPRPLGLMLLAALGIKILAEQYWGIGSLFSQFADYPIASESHVYGIVVGIMVEAWRRITHARHAHSEKGPPK